jgi:hypothetical protein
MEISNSSLVFGRWPKHFMGEQGQEILNLTNDERPKTNGREVLILTNDQRRTTNDQPQVRRMKTYTGGQGYVYQYYFVGKRPAPGDPSTTEFVFDVTSDRKTTFSVSIFLPKGALDAWNRGHGRRLTEAEQYAAVKMRLFQAFDEIGDMMANGRELRVDADSMEELLGGLGVA